MFPVTVAQPNPDPASLTATLVSVGTYGAIAVGFWLWFRWRAGRTTAAEAVEGALTEGTSASTHIGALEASPVETVTDPVGAVDPPPRTARPRQPSRRQSTDASGTASSGETDPPRVEPDGPAAPAS
jgi:hypothetical protein